MEARTFGLLSECSENRAQFRQGKSRIFMGFCDVASVFLNHWVSEQAATSYIDIEGG